MKLKKEDISNNILFIVFTLVMLYSNPVSWIIYAAVLGIMFFFLGDRTKKTFAISFVFSSLLIALIISVSPYLKMKDFQLTHPNYEISDFRITHFKGDFESRYKATGYYYGTIDYTYVKNGKTYHQQEKEAIKWDDFTGDYKQNKTKINQLIKENKCFVFVNSDNPNESKLFCSDKYFYLEGSEGYYFFQDMSFGTIGIILFIGIMAGGLIFKENNHIFLKNTKIIISIILAFICGFSVLSFIRIEESHWLNYRKMIFSIVPIVLFISAILTHIMMWLPTIKKMKNKNIIIVVFGTGSIALFVFTFLLSAILFSVFKSLI